MSKGVIGLQMAWLKKHATCKEEHNDYKRLASEAGLFEERRLCREEFLQLANRHGGVYQRIWDVEKSERGGFDTEPMFVNM